MSRWIIFLFVDYQWIYLGGYYQWYIRVWYLVPIFISLVLIGITICGPWMIEKYKKWKNPSNEHQENMAELTSLIETVMNFELDQSSTISNVRNLFFFVFINYSDISDTDSFNIFNSDRPNILILHFK